MEGGGWQAKPPTCVSSKGGGSGGHESPPSLLNHEWEGPGW